jgi:hypothetical protein
VATEQFANNAQSSLAAAIAAGDTSLTVANAVPFPASGNFRVIIDGEILLVTAVTGNTFTVTRGAEGTTAAAHANGAYVTHVLTAAALSNCPRAMTTAGDVEYLAASGAVTRRAIGSTGQVLTVVSGLPAWQSAAAALTPTPTKTGAYTAAGGDLVICDAGGGTFTVTLPSAASVLLVAVKKQDASGNAVTVSRAGSDTIYGLTSGGQTTFNVTGEGDTYWLVSDGSASWHVVDYFLSPSYCDVYATTSQTFGNGTATGVNMDSENSDPDGLHSTSTNTSRVTIKKPGLYLITGFMTFKPGAGYREVDIQKNGVVSGSTLVAGGANTNNDYISCSVVTEAPLAAGDYVELTGYQTTGGNLDSFVGAQNKPHLTVQRVGP